MKKGQTVVATFSDLEKAETVKKTLVQAGIPAEVQNESILQRFWFVSKPLAAHKVFVPTKDFEGACHVLREANAVNHVLQGEIRCLQCGSANIEYPQFTRKFMTTTVVEILCLLHILEKEFYCHGCHHTWPNRLVVKKRIDVLNWPKKTGELTADVRR